MTPACEDLLFAHDLRANAFRVCREGKPLHIRRVKPEDMLFLIMRYSSPDSSAALPPAAAVLMVTVCSVAKRVR